MGKNLVDKTRLCAPSLDAHLVLDILRTHPVGSAHEHEQHDWAVGFFLPRPVRGLASAVETKSIEGYYVIGVARMSASFRDKLRHSTLVAMLPVAV
jgi:hypothetical protein